MLSLSRKDENQCVCIFHVHHLQLNKLFYIHGKRKLLRSIVEKVSKYTRHYFSGMNAIPKKMGLSVGAIGCYWDARDGGFHVAKSTTSFFNLRNFYNVDYSGYGQSSGKSSEQNTYADIEAAYRCLKVTYGVKEDVILYGNNFRMLLYFVDKSFVSMLHSLVMVCLLCPGQQAITPTPVTTKLRASILYNLYKQCQTSPPAPPDAKLTPVIGDLLNVLFSDTNDRYGSAVGILEGKSTPLIREISLKNGKREVIVADIHQRVTKNVKRRD
ncbi:hypothetical protein L1987_76973 [Smallanthus sonchifolius]|uniref:Uncharacterized protein n=1 Tax=Smallanthus sonchifolius TaxID=185202 RepID=A0ACB8ZD24_9ASTR|nr:hypothetical protein L1987_76973 [Smallanthus sonchifolius]